VAACNIAHQAKIVSCAHIVSVMLWCCAMSLMFLKQKLAVSCLVIYTQQNRQLCSKVMSFLRRCTGLQILVYAIKPHEHGSSEGTRLIKLLL